MLFFAGLRQGIEMASPDLDDGYIRISRELFDAECRTKMSGSEWQTFKFIQRKTYGYHKKMDMIAYSQFSEATGLDRRRVIEATKSLEARNMIVVTKNGPRKPNNYGIQKDFHKWIEVTKNALCRGLVTKSGKPSDKKRRGLVTKSAPTKETLTKETLQKKVQHRKLTFSDDDMKTAVFIFNRVLILNPEHKPVNFEKWANTIRLIVQQDKKTHKQICELFLWANKDDFWQDNVQCPAKLRKQWDNLTGRKKKEESGNGKNKQTHTSSAARFADGCADAWGPD